MTMIFKGEKGKQKQDVNTIIRGTMPIPVVCNKSNMYSVIPRAITTKLYKEYTKHACK